MYLIPRDHSNFASYKALALKTKIVIENSYSIAQVRRLLFSVQHSYAGYYRVTRRCIYGPFTYDVRKNMGFLDPFLNVSLTQPIRTIVCV